MGASSSKPPSTYLTLFHNHRSVLILRPPTLAAARDKAFSLFAVRGHLTATGQQVRLLLEGVELTDEVWELAVDGSKLQVELAGQRRRATTDEGAEVKAPDRKRGFAETTASTGAQSKEDDHQHSSETPLPPPS